MIQFYFGGLLGGYPMFEGSGGDSLPLMVGARILRRGVQYWCCTREGCPHKNNELRLTSESEPCIGCACVPPPFNNATSFGGVGDAGAADIMSSLGKRGRVPGAAAAAAAAASGGGGGSAGGGGSSDGGGGGGDGEDDGGEVGAGGAGMSTQMRKCACMR